VILFRDLGDTLETKQKGDDIQQSRSQMSTHTDSALVLRQTHNGRSESVM